MRIQPKYIAHIALFTVALIYGINYSVAKDVMPDYLQPRGFILLRAFGATALFSLLSWLYPSERIQRKDLLRLIGGGLFGVAANQIMFFEGLNITTPIDASVIMTTNPIMVLMLSALFLKVPVTIYRVLGIVLGIGGALYLITRGMGNGASLGSGKSMGNLLVFLNAASYAAYLITVKPLMSKYKPLTVIRWVFLFGMLIVLPLGAEQFMNVSWDSLPIDIIWKMCFVVIFTTFFAYLLNIYALKLVSSTTVSFYIYLQPLIASSVAIALGKDQLSLELFISAFLIFAGVYLVSFYKRP